MSLHSEIKFEKKSPFQEGGQTFLSHCPNVFIYAN